MDQLKQRPEWFVIGLKVYDRQSLEVIATVEPDKAHLLGLISRAPQILDALVMVITTNLPNEKIGEYIELIDTARKGLEVDDV
jgi:hypothetical protein